LLTAFSDVSRLSTWPCYDQLTVSVTFVGAESTPVLQRTM